MQHKNKGVSKIRCLALLAIQSLPSGGTAVWTGTVHVITYVIVGAPPTHILTVLTKVSTATL